MFWVKMYQNSVKMIKKRNFCFALFVLCFALLGHRDFSFFERWMVVRNGSDGGVWYILWYILWMLRGAVCGKKLSATKFVINICGWWMVIKTDTIKNCFDGFVAEFATKIFCFLFLVLWKWMVRYSYDVGMVGQEYFRWVFGLGFGWICI
jgi:hypothetical protein